jgi:hypothetical protein
LFLTVSVTATKPVTLSCLRKLTKELPKRQEVTWIPPSILFFYSLHDCEAFTSRLHAYRRTSLQSCTRKPPSRISYSTSVAVTRAYLPCLLETRSSLLEKPRRSSTIQIHLVFRRGNLQVTDSLRQQKSSKRRTFVGNGGQRSQASCSCASSTIVYCQWSMIHSWESLVLQWLDHAVWYH